jgi:hypothetical protein
LYLGPGHTNMLALLPSWSATEEISQRSGRPAPDEHILAPKRICNAGNFIHANGLKQRKRCKAELHIICLTLMTAIKEKHDEIAGARNWGFVHVSSSLRG